jgi:hypothetical protein
VLAVEVVEDLFLVALVVQAVAVLEQLQAQLVVLELLT